MTLEEFLERAPDTLRAFAAATKIGIERGEFITDRHESDWFREVSAYVQYVDLEEHARQLGIEP